MKFEAPLYDLPKDNDGFFDAENENMYNDDLPILVLDERDGLFYLVNYDNWADWLSDFNKPCYNRYIKVSDITLVKE